MVIGAGMGEGIIGWKADTSIPGAVTRMCRAAGNAAAAAGTGSMAIGAGVDLCLLFPFFSSIVIMDDRKSSRHRELFLLLKTRVLRIYVKRKIVKTSLT
jgi:hypothetical protein